MFFFGPTFATSAELVAYSKYPQKSSFSTEIPVNTGILRVKIQMLNNLRLACLVISKHCVVCIICTLYYRCRLLMKAKNIFSGPVVTTSRRRFYIQRFGVESYEAFILPSSIDLRTEAATASSSTQVKTFNALNHLFRTS